MSRKKPNIIIILIDALRAKNLGCSSFTQYDISPVIDKLAKKSIFFENAFSSTNASDPSITSIMSGKYPLSHGILNHGHRVTKKEINYFKDNVKQTLPEFLRSEGYFTYSLDWLGRWHRKGFDYYLGATRYSELNKGLGWSLEKRRFFLIKLFSRFKLVASLLRLLKLKLKKSDNVSYENAEFVMNKSLALLKDHNQQRKQQSFFMFIHFWDMHSPYYFQKEFMRKVRLSQEERDYLRRIFINKNIRSPILQRLRLLYVEELVSRYCSKVTYIDHQVGRLLDALKQMDAYDDTLIIITADHGQNFFEKNIYFDHHALYDPTIHVPLMLHKKGLSNRRVSDLVQNIDIFPTIMALLGKPVDKSLDGQDLLDTKKKRDFLFFEEAYAQNRHSLRTKKYKYISALSKDDDLICQYCKVSHGGYEELYDLESDPFEEKDISGSNKDVVEKFRNQLNKHVKKILEKKKSSERNLIDSVVQGMDFI